MIGTLLIPCYMNVEVNEQKANCDFDLMNGNEIKANEAARKKRERMNAELN